MNSISKQRLSELTDQYLSDSLNLSDIDSLVCGLIDLNREQENVSNTQDVINQLGGLLSTARMDDANFNKVHENNEVAIIGKERKLVLTDKDTYIKEHTRPYRDFWLVAPLERLIKQLAGD
jgi:hypothetical protein